MVHSPLGVMDAIVMAQIWKGHTDNLFSISRAWNMHRPPMNTEQPTNQLGSVSFVDAIMSKRITYVTYAVCLFGN